MGGLRCVPSSESVKVGKIVFPHLSSTDMTFGVHVTHTHRRDPEVSDDRINSGLVAVVGQMRNRAASTNQNQTTGVHA